MSEYIVDGAEPNSTVLKSTTPNGYEHEKWLPVREEIVRCRDCVAYEPYLTYAGMKLDFGECMQHRRQTNDDRFCWWAERRDA